MNRWIVELLVEFYESLRYSIKDIAIFPGDNLLGVLKFAIILTVISLSLDFLGIIVFLDWRGAALGTGILSFVYLISKRGDSSGASDLHGVSSEYEEELEVQETRSDSEK